MMSHKHAFLTASLLALLLLPHLALAAEPVGWVQDKSGVVTIYSGGSQNPATIGAGVRSKDRITTSRAARVQIMFKDKTTLALSEMSECVIGDVYLEASEKKKSRFSLNIVKGIFGLLAGGIAEHNKEGFKVTTPEVAVGIRGTEFASAVASGSELHGLYEGGPVVVTATDFKKTAGSAGPEKQKQICETLEDTIDDMQRAYRSKWGAGKHTEARKFQTKAEEYEKLRSTYNCQ